MQHQCKMGRFAEAFVGAVCVGVLVLAGRIICEFTHRKLVVPQPQCPRNVPLQLAYRQLEEETSHLGLLQSTCYVDPHERHWSTNRTHPQLTAMQATHQQRIDDLYCVTRRAGEWLQDVLRGEVPSDRFWQRLSTLCWLPRIWQSLRGCRWVLFLASVITTLPAACHGCWQWVSRRLCHGGKQTTLLETCTREQAWNRGGCVGPTVEHICGICHDKLLPQDKTLVLPCDHGALFHKRCLWPWLKRRDRCPTCCVTMGPAWIERNRLRRWQRRRGQDCCSLVLELVVAVHCGVELADMCSDPSPFQIS